MAPAQVNSKNENEILNRVYRISEKMIKFKFKVGDYVRISKVKRLFKKGYTPNWSFETFKIKNRFQKFPPVYTIEDKEGEEIEGKFYEEELQKVQTEFNDLFVIEKIIKTRKTKGVLNYFVKFKNFPNSYNQWVSNLITL